MASISRVGNHARPVICCDFDGTITQVDVTDLLLSELAHPSWREIEQEWVRGQIGSRECLERQMALVDASSARVNALIDSVPIDPDFKQFMSLLRKRALPLHVLSDGFDLVIRRVFRQADIRNPLPGSGRVFASTLKIRGKRAVTSFPYSGGDCSHGCATCKATIIRQLRRKGSPVVFIGDGLSDRFAAEEADWVLAKRTLADYCREHGIPFEPIETFSQAGDAVEGLLGELRPAPLRRALAVVPL